MKSTQEYEPYSPSCPRVLQQFFPLLFRHARHARSSFNRFTELGLLLVTDVMIVTLPFGLSLRNHRGSIPTVAGTTALLFFVIVGSGLMHETRHDVYCFTVVL